MVGCNFSASSHTISEISTWKKCTTVTQSTQTVVLSSVFLFPLFPPSSPASDLSAVWSWVVFCSSDLIRYGSDLINPLLFKNRQKPILADTWSPGGFMTIDFFCVLPAQTDYAFKSQVLVGLPRGLRFVLDSRSVRTDNAPA